MKCRALTLANWIDDEDIPEEEGIGDILLDDNVLSSVPRPGTSLTNVPATASARATRPLDSSGRPLTGYMRPGTGRRQKTSARSGESEMRAMLRSSHRPGTAARPVTSLGRQVRLGTASLMNNSNRSGIFIDADRLDLAKYARRPALGKVLCDYLLYHDQNPKKAAELCAEATEACEFKDWWWKARLGKSYYRLGMLRLAEKQFESSLRQSAISSVVLELVRIYTQKLDQPNTALEVLRTARDGPCRNDPRILINMARIHDTLQTPSNVEDKKSGGRNEGLGVDMYRQVLRVDPTSVEAISCLAAHYFYTDRPEVAVRFYRRLLQMGIADMELWNNLGLCCFHANQYDIAISCFLYAFDVARENGHDQEDTSALADVWYNIGHVAIGLGDLQLAYQCFKVSATTDPNHAEAHNNLGVLEMQRGRVDRAKSNFSNAERVAPYLYEPSFNGAILSYQSGDFEESHRKVRSALRAYPTHGQALDLLASLEREFA